MVWSGHNHGITTVIPCFYHISVYIFPTGFLLDAQTTVATLADLTMKILGTLSTLSWTNAPSVCVIKNVTKCLSTKTWTNVDLSNKKTHGEHEGNCKQLQGTHHERRSPYRIVSVVCYQKRNFFQKENVEQFLGNEHGITMVIPRSNQRNC